ncbi:MAG: hypothetical protein V7701_00105 [Sneathiella sp.]
MHGLHFLAALQGLQAPQAFFAAQGLQAPQAFFAPQAPQALHTFAAEQLATAAGIIADEAIVAIAAAVRTSLNIDVSCLFINYLTKIKSLDAKHGNFSSKSRIN